MASIAIPKELLVKIGGRSRELERAGQRSQAVIRRIGTSATQMSKKVAGIGVALAGLGFAAKRAFLDPAAAQEEAVTSLAQALASTGKTGEEALRRITAEASRLQRITKAGDESLVQASATLATLAPSLDPESLERSQTALVAISDTFTKGDIESAAQLLGKTLGSSTNALSRYGIQVDTAASARAKLDAILANPTVLAAFDVAQARAKTLAGSEAQLANAIGDVREQMGFILADTLGLADGSSTLTNRILDQADSLRENRAEWVAWGRVVIAAMKFAGESIRGLVRLAFNAGQMIGRSFDIGFNLLIGSALKAYEKVRSFIPGLGDREERSADFFATAREQAAGLVGDLGDMGAALEAVAGRWTDIRDAATEAYAAAGGESTASTPAVVAGSGAAGGTGGSGTAFSRAPGMQARIDAMARSIQFGIENLKRLPMESSAVMAAVQSHTSQWVDGFSSTLADFVTTGKLRFKEFAKSVIHDLTKIAAKMAIFRVLGSLGVPGLAQVAGAVPGRAIGGAVFGGRPYVVGERGRELFVPTGSGRVVPNHQLGGGNTFVLDASRMPSAADPRQAARDAQWLRFLGESIREWGNQGGRFAGSGA